MRAEETEERAGLVAVELEALLTSESGDDDLGRVGRRRNSRNLERIAIATLREGIPTDLSILVRTGKNIGIAVRFAATRASAT